MKVLSLAGWETSKALSMAVGDLKPPMVEVIPRENIVKGTLVIADEAAHYYAVPDHFEAHGTVCHSQGDHVIGEFHTSTIEGCFSVFKRGMNGIYQHRAKKHLHGYLAEFGFRYNHRVEPGIGATKRAEVALSGIVGRRLTYRGLSTGSLNAPSQ
jgi:hypothetical protein